MSSLLKGQSGSAIADDSDDSEELITRLNSEPTPAPGPFNKGRVGSGGSRTTKRRESNANIDAVHDILLPTDISPAQMYLTESGHLYHAGKLVIVLVGLPARGKTHHAVALTRYLRWLGVRTHAFHLGDYRRKLSGEGFKVPDDYFQLKASKATVEFREKVEKACMDELLEFLKLKGGQVAIYDAVNPTVARRRALKAKLEEEKVNTLFVECISTNDSLVARNVKDVKLSSPDFQGVDYQDAVRSYLKRIELRIPHYEPMTEAEELSYIKLINASERFELNRAPLGYLQNRIVFFLMNTHIKSGCVYFARAGCSNNSELDYKDDDPLNASGRDYAVKLKTALLAHLEERRLLLQSGRSTAIDTPTSPVTGEGESEPWNQNSVMMMAEEQIQARLAKAKVSATPENRHLFTTPTPTAKLMASHSRSEDAYTHAPMLVWSSERLRTIETADYFKREGFEVKHRSQLTQLNPGGVDGLSDAEIQAQFPQDYAEHQDNPYHHRYARSESYHDLALRMEPLIMEMERNRGDLLVIAHESVLRVLYGYLMACTVQDIPFLKFPRNELVEIVPNAYYNIANRIPINDTLP